MWRRFKRMVQSNLGRLSDVGGGRGLTGDLEREARALDQALKRAGEGLITVRGEVTFLEEKARKLARREEELVALEQAAVSRGVEAAAGSYALELARVKTERATTDRQLAVAREALERGQIARAALQAQREQKLAEAREREKAYLELEREDLGAGAGPELDAPRKTVGGPPPSAAAEEPAFAAARSTKTIGPEPAAVAAPPTPTPAAELKIKVKSREGEAPAEAPAPAQPPTDLVGELERLVRLREQGVLSEDELEQAKRRLLGPGAGA